MISEIDVRVGREPGVLYATVGAGISSENSVVAISNVGIVVITDHDDLSGEWYYDNLVWNLVLERTKSGNLFTTIDSITGRLRLFNADIGEYVSAFDRLQLADKVRILERYRLHGHAEIPSSSVIKEVSAISYGDILSERKELIEIGFIPKECAAGYGKIGACV